MQTKIPLFSQLASCTNETRCTIQFRTARHSTMWVSGHHRRCTGSPPPESSPVTLRAICHRKNKPARRGTQRHRERQDTKRGAATLKNKSSFVTNDATVGPRQRWPCGDPLPTRTARPAFLLARGGARRARGLGGDGRGPGGAIAAPGSVWRSTHTLSQMARLRVYSAMGTPPPRRAPLPVPTATRAGSRKDADPPNDRPRGLRSTEITLTQRPVLHGTIQFQNRVILFVIRYAIRTHVSPGGWLDPAP